MMLNKGDTCYVRLNTGKIVKSKYIGDAGDKDHWVFEKNTKIATKYNPKNSRVMCRFVCMTGMRKEYVDSINN